MQFLPISSILITCCFVASSEHTSSNADSLLTVGICMSPGNSTTMHFCFSSRCTFANFHQVHVLNCSEKHALTLHRGDRSSISFCGGSHGLHSMRHLSLNLSLHALHDSQRLSSCLFPACCAATCMFPVSFCVCPQRTRDSYFHPSRLSSSLPVDVKSLILPQ